MAAPAAGFLDMRRAPRVTGERFGLFHSGLTAPTPDPVATEGGALLLGDAPALRNLVLSLLNRPLRS